MSAYKLRATFRENQHNTGYSNATEIRCTLAHARGVIISGHHKLLSISHVLFRFLVSCGGMPLWSVEEWRARIGSSWAALGRPIRCSSHCRKQRRHYVLCCPALAGGGGGMVVSTIPMVTTITLLIHSMSLIIVLPLEETGSSPHIHSELDTCKAQEYLTFMHS